MPGSIWATFTTTVREGALLVWHLANFMLQDANSTDVEAAESILREALFITDPFVDRQSLIEKKGYRVAGTREWAEITRLAKPGYKANRVSCGSSAVLEKVKQCCPYT